MLNFILGRAASGRTYTIMQRIKNDVVNGKDIVLIIPEQFSFECERQLLRTLGDSAAMRVEVLSFSRICDEVNRIAGGNAFSVMSDCDKIITMRAALKATSGELKVWGRYTDSARFSKIIIDTIDELKTCDITPEKLSSISFEGSLGFKIDDIKKIYSTYEALISNRFIDPTDKLTHLYNKLNDFKYFKNKEVYIDSFKDFTGQQYKILERIISQANSVTVSLLSDGREEEKADVFYNLRRVKRKILSIASKYNVKYGETAFLEGSKYSSEELKNVEKSFFGEAKAFEKETEDLFLCSAENIVDEAQFVARNIRKLVRENGYRYKDFVIIARDTAPYENAIINACKKNEVSCFYDEKKSIENMPICVMALSALSASNRINSKDILSFLKTELAPLDYSQVTQLENYINLWNIDGRLWLDEWSLNPFGLRSEETENKDIDGLLKNINSLREKAIKPILDLKNNFGDTAREHCEALLKFFDDCNAKDKLKIWEKNILDDNDDCSADYLRQGFERFIDILDSIVKCVGDKPLSFTDFYDTLSLAIKSTTIGTIPQMLDQVTFGSADRIRPSRPKIAFILGLNQGVFPQTPSSTGVFAAYERKQLIENGIEINDNAVEQAITENLLVYTSLCCPSDKLFLSYLTGGSEKNEPASVIGKIKKYFPNIKNISAKSNMYELYGLPETADAIFSKYCEGISEGEDFSKDIKEVIKKHPELSNKVDLLENKLSSNIFSLSPSSTQMLYGNIIKTSATDFEVFHRCKFSHFCRYGLRLSRLQPAALDVMQRGTIVHFVLENYIREYSNKLKELKEDEIRNIVSSLINRYFSLIPGIEQVKSARFKFMVDIITESVSVVAIQVTKELAQSDFVPAKCELSIGNGGDVDAVEIKFDESSAMKLIGKIDRVDVWNGYVRIVDYKTGAKAFKLPDVFYGLNLQMLIYMYALLQSKDNNFADLQPAGILYMPSSKKLGKDDLCMNGIVLKSEEVALAMEKGNEGKYVPKMKMNKDGTIADSDSYVENEVFKTVFDYITYLMKEMGKEIKKGNISVSPIDDNSKTACKYCDFASICHIEDAKHNKVEYASKDEILSKMKGCVNNGI